MQRTVESVEQYGVLSPLIAAHARKVAKRGILPLQKSTFPYICIANKGKCFCLAHYEVPIAKDTVNSQ